MEELLNLKMVTNSRIQPIYSYVILIFQPIKIFQKFKGINILSLFANLSTTDDQNWHLQIKMTNICSMYTSPLCIIYSHIDHINITFPKQTNEEPRTTPWCRRHYAKNATSYCVKRVIQGRLGGGVHLIDTAR